LPSTPLRHRKLKIDLKKDFIKIQREERISRAYNQISDMENKD